jgi:hypothetical protein
MMGGRPFKVAVAFLRVAIFLIVDEIELIALLARLLLLTFLLAVDICGFEGGGLRVSHLHNGVLAVIVGKIERFVGGVVGPVVLRRVRRHIFH